MPSHIPPFIDSTATRVQTTLEPNLRKIGTLIPKSVGEIKTSRWTLGCETLDRGYADYDVYKAYLPALGIQRIRLQGGWAECEREPGIYDFAWLDSIIRDAKKRGLAIWLQVSYGNPIYPEGGGRSLSGGFPRSEEALAAWDRWVGAMAQRYKNLVPEWEVWNEPDLNPEHTAEMITEFNIRTAEIIKRHAPAARIAGLSLVNPDPGIIDHFMKTLAARNKLGLFHWVVVHCYTKNPDDAHVKYQKAWEVIRKYSSNMQLWQGESGTHSEWCPAGALNFLPWTELTQAKWVTRRMLGDIAHDMDSSVFTAVDLDYRTTPFHNGLVRYGLIKTAGASQGFRLLKVKMAYYAVQNVVAVFNDAVELAPDANCRVECEKPVAAFSFQLKTTKAPIHIFWDKSSMPLNSLDVVKTTLRINSQFIKDPVWVDVLTGGIHQIPPNRVSFDGTEQIFSGIPLYDAPAFITDAATLEFEKSTLFLHEEAKSGE